MTALVAAEGRSPGDPVEGPRAFADQESGLAAALRDGGLIARRNITLYLRNPASIAGALVFPLIFLFGFHTVLSRSLEARGIDAAQYLPPIVVVQALFFAAMSSAFYLADDRTRGLLDRFRSLPMHRWAPLLGRVTADLSRAMVSTAVLLVASYVIGFRFEAGLPAAVGFLLVVALFVVTVDAGCAIVGLRSSSPEAASSTLALPYLPLLMLSSGFVPVIGFPGWLQPFVRWQPVSLTVESLRALASGGATAEPVLRTVIVLVLLSITFGFLAARAFRRAA